MLPDLETYAAASKIDREITIRRAERRALLLATATRPRSAPAGVTAETAAMRWGFPAGFVRSLRSVLRPAHA